MLEPDRRHIRNKIFAVKKELKEVEAHRERNRQKRKNSERFFRLDLLATRMPGSQLS